MKKLFMITAVIMMAASVKLNAQIRIDWQQCYGNTVDDYAYNIHETDNGLAVFGLVYEDPYERLVPETVQRRDKQAICCPNCPIRMESVGHANR